MFKFIHAADMHLDSPLHRLDAYEGAPVDQVRRATRKAFENLVRAAIINKVSFVVISGDLFDGDWKDYSTGLYFVHQTTRLQDAGISVYIAAGNHDAASRITRSLRWPRNVHLFSTHTPETFKIEKLQVAIHGQGYKSQTITKDLSESYPPPLADCFNIGVLHTCLTGRAGHEPYAPCTLSGLKSKGYDYWALGHVHNHEILSEDPLVVFSGSIQGRHVRESGPKGCVLVTVDDNDQPMTEFIALDVIRWHILNLNVSGIEGGYDLVDRFGEALDTLMNQQDSRPMVVRVIFQGELSVHDKIMGEVERWISEIRSAALTAGGGQIWLEKIQFHTQPPETGEEMERSDNAIAQLLRFVKFLEDDDDQLLAMAEYLQDLEKKLPPELKAGSEAVSLSNPLWLKEMLTQVAPMLIHRLTVQKGKQ